MERTAAQGARGEAFRLRADRFAHSTSYPWDWTIASRFHATQPGRWCVPWSASGTTPPHWHFIALTVDSACNDLRSARVTIDSARCG